LHAVLTAPGKSYYRIEPMDLMSAALTASEEQARAVEALLRKTRENGRDIPRFWEPGVGQERYIPVEDAEIRAFHFHPARPQAVRPIVVLPGWGATPEGFQELYAVLHGKAELYYLETREKTSSRILHRRPDMSVSRSARDVQAALEALGLAGRRDFLLLGACWGGTIILRGLAEGSLEAPTIVVADPMHTLWFSRWVLRHISPLLPTPVVHLLRPILLHSMLGDMKEPVQKQRTFQFVRSADVWKWKKAAEAAQEIELFGALSGIQKEVFVLNGTGDKLHDQRDYPRIAGELPRGRFLFLPTDESLREHLFGAVALEFAGVSAGEGLPPSLAGFEKQIR
jgi:pimeloyl-ACP methyl ester carboxylesterase